MNKQSGHILFYFCVIIIFSTILLVQSCKNNKSVKSIQSGTVRISIINNSARDISSGDSATASEYSDTYEILIYNSTTVLSTVADSSTGPITLSVEEGTYTVLALAGSASASDGVLLGSGFESSVTVNPDAVTDISLALTSISHTYTVPESVTCSGEYTVLVTGDTNNQLLQITHGGTAMANKPYLEIGADSENIYLECNVTGSSWSGTKLLNAPPLAETSNIKFFGSNIKLIDPSYSIDDELENIGSLNWQWPNYSDMPESLMNEVKREIIFASTNTGIGITIDWS